MDKRGLLPKLKKKVSNFLSDEDGKISKQGLLVLSGVAAGSMVFASKNTQAYHHDNCLQHTNGPEGVDIGGDENRGLSFVIGDDTLTVTASHEHHSNHGSHGTHSSHGSHGSHASW